MNREMLEGHWKELQGLARQKWGQLTDDDLARIEGRRTELVGTLQKRYGKAKEEVEREVDAWLDSLARPATTPAR